MQQYGWGKSNPETGKIGIFCRTPNTEDFRRVSDGLKTNRTLEAAPSQSRLVNAGSLLILSYFSNFCVGAAKSDQADAG